MTDLEAAAKVLAKAAMPLHYREITRRALDEKLIEPKGKTPEATMGAPLYMAVKQADGTDGGPLFRLTERGHFSVVAAAHGTLDSDIVAQDQPVWRRPPRTRWIVCGLSLETATLARSWVFPSSQVSMSDFFQRARDPM